MKTLKYIFAVLILSTSLLGCSKDNDDEIATNPVEGLTKIYEFVKTDHTIEVYSTKAKLEVGYNELTIRILDNGSNNYISNAEITWMPMMHMGSMGHSGPHSMLTNSENNTVYKGHLVFQMAGNDTEYWEITLNYKFNGEALSITERVSVAMPADGKKKTQVFTGSDDAHYVLAFVNPQDPQVAVNDFQAVLYKMEDMMTFSVVENYTIAVDPRMPSMGNHSSPNNQDMVYNAATKMYDGKLSFTMTGFWKINLKLLDISGETIKGEDVTEEHPESSLYFELEF